MKLLNKFLAFALAVTCALALAGCKEEEKPDENRQGWALEYDIEKKDGKDVAIIKGLYLSEKERTELEKNDYEPIELELGNPEADLYIVREKGDPVYEDGENGIKVLKREKIKCDYYKIADGAFTNQTIIKSVKVLNSVKEIGKGAFAGCSGIEKMVLPFAGTKKGAVNEDKLFMSLFGTSECAACTAVETNYNNTADKKAKYFVPDALKEIEINYVPEEAAEGEEPSVDSLPEYAFNKLTKVGKITVTGINEIKPHAFEGCSGLYEINIPDGVETIYQSAFEGCGKLMVINRVEDNFINFPSKLRMIMGKAFKDCRKLGYGENIVIKLPGVELFDHAFAGCESIKTLDLSLLDSVAESAFSGCKTLKTLYLKEGADVKNGAFWNCPDLKTENIKVLQGEEEKPYDESLNENQGFDFR